MGVMARNLMQDQSRASPRRTCSVYFAINGRRKTTSQVRTVKTDVDKLVGGDVKVAGQLGSHCGKNLHNILLRLILDSVSYVCEVYNEVQYNATTSTSWPNIRLHHISIAQLGPFVATLRAWDNPTMRVQDLERLSSQQEQAVQVLDLPPQTGHPLSTPP